MFTVMLEDGTRFQWCGGRGLDILSNGKNGVAELSEMQIDKVRYVEAHGREVYFVKKHYPALPSLGFGDITRWSGDFAKFIIINLQFVVSNEKANRHGKRQV